MVLSFSRSDMGKLKHCKQHISHVIRLIPKTVLKLPIKTQRSAVKSTLWFSKHRLSQQEDDTFAQLLLGITSAHETAGTNLIRRLSGNSALHSVHFQTDGCLHTQPPHNNKHTRHFSPQQRQTGAALRPGSHYHNTTPQVTQTGGSPDSPGQTACVPHVSSSTLDKRSLLTAFFRRWCQSQLVLFLERGVCSCYMDMPSTLLIAGGRSDLSQAALFPLFCTSARFFLSLWLKLQQALQVEVLIREIKDPDRPNRLGTSTGPPGLKRWILRTNWEIAPLITTNSEVVANMWLTD